MINVRELCFAYPRAKAPALHNLNFRVERGEIFGFLGPSGAGKSTTQKILIGLLKNYRGSVTIMDREVSRWGADYYERVGISFELPNHFLKLSGRENLHYFAGLYRGPTRSPDSLLEQLGLSDAADELVERYSKGMRNRLTLARALLHNPALLFLDEPTSGLDPLSARNVKDLIRAQQQAGCTVFLSTHNMAVAEELCDRLALLVDGHIVLIDQPRALKLRFGAPTLRVSYRNGAGLQERDFNLDGIGDNQDFLALLRSGTVRSIHTQEASLEDVFLSATGRSAL